MLDCMHKFRARSHKISTPSSRYGFSHDLHDVFFFDVHVENTGMTLAFRLAWSVLCCGHENRVRTRVTRGSGQPKEKNLGEGFFGERGPGNLEFFWSRLIMPFRQGLEKFYLLSDFMYHADSTCSYRFNPQPVWRSDGFAAKLSSLLHFLTKFSSSANFNFMFEELALS